ncbi:hypothetical protein V6N11_006452 [Hibiscus sabdariffa]|uniref:RING-type E3 ubiquitin transferase n=1 Tax=Hibiscus sabdariffa TaxID=183260 RepID=A0ABR2RQS9_9ROSI
MMIVTLIRCFCNDSSHDLETGLARYPARVDRSTRVPRPSTIGVIVRYQNMEENINCVICLEEFKDGDSCRLLVNCKHLYHQLCVDQWLSKDMHCPLCRGPVHGLELAPATSSDQNQTYSPQIFT